METPTGTEGEVCKDIARRQALGIKKYGTTVAANPLSLKQWLQHQYEELLDAAVYAKRAIEELEKKTAVAAPPVGTLEQRVFKKYPLLSQFEFAGITYTVWEHQKKSPGHPGICCAFVSVPGIPPVESRLICSHPQHGAKRTQSFTENMYPALLAL